jgi:hypothetical protein
MVILALFVVVLSHDLLFLSRGVLFLCQIPDPSLVDPFADKPTCTAI